MAFFKETRDQLKGNALVSHLEFAVQRFDPGNPRNMSATTHLSDAQQALVALRKAEGEYVLSKVGWEYVARLCWELKTLSQVGGFDQMARDCDYISEYCAQMIKRAVE